MFKDGSIDGLIIKPLKVFEDDRGWLTEIFRKDELTSEIMPVMSYISLTKSGMARGPHEHVDQIDYFAFFGPGNFLFMTWDNRKESPTFNNRVSTIVGSSNQTIVIVPPGIVHAYANLCKEDGLVFNCPNRLYAGKDKKEKVDEVRHEDDSQSPFVIDFKEQSALKKSDHGGAANE